MKAVIKTLTSLFAHKDLDRHSKLHQNNLFNLRIFTWLWTGEPNCWLIELKYITVLPATLAFSLLFVLYYSVCGPRVKYLSFKCLCKIHGTCQPCQVVLKARETKNKSVCFDFDIFAACLGSKFFRRTEDFSSTQTLWRVTCYILVCHTYKIGIWWTYRATSLTNCGYSWHVCWRKWF